MDEEELDDEVAEKLEKIEEELMDNKALDDELGDELEEGLVDAGELNDELEFEEELMGDNAEVEDGISVEPTADEELDPPEDEFKAAICALMRSRT